MLWQVSYDAPTVNLQDAVLVTPHASQVRLYLLDHGCDKWESRWGFTAFGCKNQRIEIHRDNDMYRVYHLRCMTFSWRRYVREHWVELFICFVYFVVVFALLL